MCNMTVKRLLIAIGVFAPLAVVSPETAAACAYDGVLGGGLSAAHPRSIAVAVAVRDAIDAGQLPDAALPAEAGNAGYWRAVRRLRLFQQSLPTPSDASIAISILFVDSNLWSRLTPTAQGFSMTLHTTGAEPGDVVIVTSEAVLAAVQDRSLTTIDALKRGLLVVDGQEKASTNAVGRLVASASLDANRDGQVLPTWLFLGAPRSRVAPEIGK